MAKIVLNREGVRELLLSPEMKEICTELAEGISMRAGDGFSVSSYDGKNRVNASVKAETKDAMKRCLRDNVLLKALGGSNG